MNTLSNSRRKFIINIGFAGVALGLQDTFSYLSCKKKAGGKRIGIIGLDTSHSIEFAKTLNHPDAGSEFAGYKVVYAYPKGSNTIESSRVRIPAITDEIKKYGVLIADSLQELLDNVDVVFLETNDGRLHLEQARLVLEARKPVFIDKPLAASLEDAITIFHIADKFNTPVFSSSSLRYISGAGEIITGKYGKVLGADVFSPAHLEKTHPDLFWYGIHGVEMLFTVMGSGCTNVIRIAMPNTDVVVGTWKDGRVGIFRGMRIGKLDYGGTVYSETGIITLGSYQGYTPLIKQIIQFFETGKPPVNFKDTLEIYAFMEAADESKRKGGASVSLDSIMKKAMDQINH